MTRFVTHIAISFDADDQTHANRVAVNIHGTVNREVLSNYPSRRVEVNPQMNPGEPAIGYIPKDDPRHPDHKGGEN